MTRSLTTYLLYFALIYVGMLILFTVISMFISSAGSSGTIIAPFLSAMLVGEMFIKREQAAPNDAQRSHLTLGSFAVFLAVNVVLTGLAVIGGVFEELQADSDGNRILFIIFAVAALIILPIVFFMIRWAYGGLTRKRAVKLLGDQSRIFD